MDTATLTPSAQVIVSLIPIVGIAFGAVIIFFALLWKHRETKQRILAGTYTSHSYNWKPFFLLTGLILIGVGLVLSIMFLFMKGFSFMLLGGLIPLVIGLAFIIFYKANIFKTQPDDKE